MLRSILQRFGLTVSRRPAEPLESRASQNTRITPLQDPPASAAQDHPQAAPSKKPAVKVPVVKATAKLSVKPKTPLKTAVKPVAKPVQPASRAKAVVKKSAEAVVKVIVSPKPPAKSPVAGKPAVKTVVQKPAIKPLSSLALKVAPKPVVPKVAATSKAPSSSQSLVAVQPARPAKLPITTVKSVPAAAAGKKNTSPATVPAPQPLPSPIERSTPMTPPVALKPGRRSSARAPSQLPPPAPMVPTHAPDAAKASYSVMTERVMAPPPHVAAKKDPKLANNWKAKSGADLTDDEVKAMPDTEYMNDKQMAFFRHKLSVLKQEIHNSAGETTEHLREETVVVPDPADRATIEEEHALELRTRDRERKLLKKIEQSIGRIDSGDYGYCDETGEPIGVGRLIARPTANLSLEAQQRRELKQKMFGD